MAQKPSIPKGTRDFSPVEMRRRQYILDTIRGVFERYGYLPIETPAMEKLETLTGKYGEEGDRLIFKVLQRGPKLIDGLAKVVQTAISNFSPDYTPDSERPNSEELYKQLYSGVDWGGAIRKGQDSLSDMALRYDLTVPFARFVVQHQHALTFPFKRYQMQPVWRADRPQKGRYREFLQCDADVIGSTSLLNEVELVQLFDDVFAALGLAVVVKLNDRKLLTGIAEVSGQPEKVVDIVTALDKLDKVGREAVEQEMRDKGVSEAAVTGIAPLFELQGTWDAQRTRLAEWLGGSEVAQQGLADMDFIFQQAGQLKSAQLEFDPTLARGLDYYTGAIFEVKAAEGTLQSSICGGGRYDDLTGIFGLQGMSGVGISFGADRIYDVLLETGKFPEDVATGTRLLFVNFGDREAAHVLPLLRQVREAGIAAELYPDAAKLKKQFAYADAKGIPYVATMGSEEIAQGIVSVKDLRSGEQRAVKTDELISLVQ